MHHPKGLALVDEGLVQGLTALELLNALGVVLDQSIFLADGLLQVDDFGF
jgi:hypothetical protein